MRETGVQSLGWEDSPGEGKGYPLQYSGQENSKDCIVREVAKSRTWLSDFHFHCSYDSWEDGMAGWPGGGRDLRTACWVMGFPGASVGKEFTGEVDSIPGSERSSREGNGNPLQCSCLGNPTDRGAWWTTAHGVAKSQARLRDWAHMRHDGVTLRGGCELGWCHSALAHLKERAGQRRRGSQPISAHSAQTPLLPMTAAICPKGTEAPTHPTERGRRGPCLPHPASQMYVGVAQWSHLLGSVPLHQVTLPPPSHLWAPHHSPHLLPHPWDFKEGHRHPPGNQLPLKPTPHQSADGSGVWTDTHLQGRWQGWLEARSPGHTEWPFLLRTNSPVRLFTGDSLQPSSSTPTPLPAPGEFFPPRASFSVLPWQISLYFQKYHQWRGVACWGTVANKYCPEMVTQIRQGPVKFKGPWALLDWRLYKW